MNIDYHLLGRLEVVIDGVSVELGSRRQRALLALLVTNAGKVLSTDRIIDELWGGSGTTDKTNTLWVHMSGLRAALQPDRPKRSEGTVLLTRRPGYVASIDPGNIDVGRFERSLDEGRLLAAIDPAAAVATLRDGLALWRGEALEEFAYEEWAQLEIHRLEELRLEATELRVEAELRLGMSSEVVAELQALVHQHPMRERFVASLMLALHRIGRTAEALRTFAMFRERLVTEAGIEPSRSIRSLEQSILADDVALQADRPAGASAPSSHPSCRRRQRVGRRHSSPSHGRRSSQI